MEITEIGQAGPSSCIAWYIILSSSWWGLWLATIEKGCKLYQETYYGLYV